MQLGILALAEYARTKWNSMGYNILASAVILPCPGLFSVLDHYPYFSQLLIACYPMLIALWSS